MEDKNVQEGISKHVRAPGEPVVAIKRCIIVPDISRVDELLLVLQKTGKGIIQVSPLPLKRTEAKGEEPIKAMVIYQDMVLEKYWGELVKSNILVDIE